MHVLNEYGFPNIVNYETSAVIKFCIDLIFVQNDVTHFGHFYTNDLKVDYNINVIWSCTEFFLGSNWYGYKRIKKHSSWHFN